MSPLYSKWAKFNPQISVLIKEILRDIINIFLKNNRLSKREVFHCEFFAMSTIVNEGLASFRTEIPNLELLPVQKSINP